jgi:hypothetical protein
VRFFRPPLYVALLMACTDGGQPPAAPEQGDLRGVLAGEAAAGLSSSGRFVLTSTPSGEPEITEVQAVALAAAWPQQWGRFLRTYLESEHGAPIQFDRLVPCQTPLYARSSFAPLAPQVHRTVRRAYGPWWLVSLCEGPTPAVSLAISAYSTDLTIVDGRIQLPAVSGNHFLPAGIPHGWDGAVRVSPERAALAASMHSRRLVASVPELYAPAPARARPQFAAWRIRLDRPVTLRGERTLDRRSHAEVYVTGNGREGSGERLVHVGTPEQPDHVEFQYPMNVDGLVGKNKATAGPVQMARGEARPAAGIAIDLEATSPATEID